MKSILGSIVVFLVALGISGSASADSSFLRVDYSIPPSLITMTIVERPQLLGVQNFSLGSVQMVSTLNPGEKYVEGEENLRRLKAAGWRLLDVRVMEELLNHPKLIPESWKRVSPIYFWGTVFRFSDSRRYIAYMAWSEKSGWYWNYIGLYQVWNGRQPAPVLAN